MKFVLDSIDSLAEPLKAEYEPKDGKFVLKTEGDNPVILALNSKIADAAAKIATADLKVNEFRTNNVALLKEVDELRPLKTKFEGLDPDVAREAITKVAALDKKGIKTPDDIDNKLKTALTEALKPFEQTITLLRDQNAAFAAKSLADAQRADNYLLQTQVSDRFVKIGGKPKATEFIVGLAKEIFEVKDGAVVAKTGKFNPEKPGESLSIDDWLATTVKEHDYTIEPSKGGGAPPHGGSGGTVSNLKPGQTVLKNPTPQELGQYAAEIASGKVKIDIETVTH